MNRVVLAGLIVSSLTMPAHAQFKEIANALKNTLEQSIETAQEPLDILNCPFKVLEEAYLSVLGHTDALNANAVEAEVLTLCTERQGLIRKILENEEQLVEMLAKSKKAEAARNKPFLDQISTLESDLVTCQASKTTGNVSANVSANIEYEDGAFPSLQNLQGADACVLSEYSINWVSISKSGAHKASLTSEDVTDIVVSEGTVLPNGSTVTKIAKGVVQVESTDGIKNLPMNTQEPEDNSEGIIWNKLKASDTFKVMKGTK